MQVHSAVQGGRGDGAGQQGVRLGCWQRAAGAFVCCECCAVGLRAMGWVHVLVPCMEVPSELPEVAAAWFELCAHLPCWKGLYLEHPHLCRCFNELYVGLQHPHELFCTLTRCISVQLMN